MNIISSSLTTYHNNLNKSHHSIISLFNRLATIRRPLVNTGHQTITSSLIQAMQPLASLVGSRQRRDITHFEETLRNIDEYWVAVERRYIALFCCLVGWNAWNIVYIFNCFFERACGYQFLSIWNLTHTICAMGAMAVFLRNKPLESLNRDNVHQQRCQHGLSLLNLYRDDKTKLLYHIHHEKKYG